MPLNFLSIEGDYTSTCGYCSTEPGKRSTRNTSHSYGVYPKYSGISCFIYMEIIDRGWRRSGYFLYKPSMQRTCCPQYTIRLDALEFSPSRSQRQVTNRWNRFILEGDKRADNMVIEGVSTNKGKATAKTPTFDLVTAVHSSEMPFLLGGNPGPVHQFEVTLEPSSFTQEKFQLYQIYQRDVHREEKKTPSSFRTFLVDSPLRAEPIPYPAPPPSHLPKNYGTYHQCYRVDGTLCAVAVLDILPRCVSSVYFMYDSRWERFSLGKVSVLREAALAREIHNAGIQSMNYVYLGFYVHSCPKMRYKVDYSPSYILDPEEYTWFPFKDCVGLLDKYRYACFSHPENSLREDNESKEVLRDVPLEILKNIYVSDVITGTANITSVTNSPYWQDPITQETVLQGINLLGTEVAQKVILDLDQW